MGDEQDGRAGAPPKVQQFVVEAVAGDLVKRAERLVHQQQTSARQAAPGRSPRALALAAGKLMRQALAERRQARSARAVRRLRSSIVRVRLPRPTWSGSRTLSRTVRHGSRVESWKTKPTSRRERTARGVSPSTRDRAARAASSRSATTRSNVDLPQPEGPRIDRNVPASTVEVEAGDHRHRPSAGRDSRHRARRSRWPSRPSGRRARRASAGRPP